MICLSGSPPRGRGKGVNVNCSADDIGITPAWAGKSTVVLPTPGYLWDHPRVGGEKLVFHVGQRGQRGSPPRGRGKDGESTGIGGADGITPAWAGKSCTALRRSARCGDHPRVGGEKTKSIHPYPVLDGSPPRGRGKVCACTFNLEYTRITPARAGKSLASQPWSPPLWMMVIRPRP